MGNEEYSMTTRDYLRVLFRQKLGISICVLTVMASAYIGLQMKTPEFQSQAKLLVSAQKGVESPYYKDLGYQNVQLALTQSELVKSNPVMERALKAIGLESLDSEYKFASPLRKWVMDWQTRRSQEQAAKQGNADDSGRNNRMLRREALENLKKKIKVDPILETNVFIISYKDFDPGVAANVVNIVSRSYVILDLEQQLSDFRMKYGDKNLAVTQIRDTITDMEQKLNGQMLSNIDAMGPASVKIVEQALPPIKPTGQPAIVIYPIAFLISLFLSITLAFGFDYLDQTFKSPQDIERLLDIPLLGSIPNNPKSNSFDLLADQIQFLSKTRNLKSLLIATTESGEDSASLVVNIGRTLMRKGQRILIVDANMKKVSFRKLLDLPAGPGLVDIIEEKVTFAQSVQTVETNLAVVSAGETHLNPVIVFESNKMNVLIHEMAQKYDLCLISAPDLTHRDSLQLSAHVDGVVMVVNEGHTRREVVKSEIDLLSKRNVPIVGMILNNRTFPIPKAIYNMV